MITKYFCRTQTGQEKKDHLYLDLTDADHIDQVIIGADNNDAGYTGGIYLNVEQVQRLVVQLQGWLGAHGVTSSKVPLWEDE